MRIKAKESRPAPKKRKGVHSKNASKSQREKTTISKQI